MLCTKLIAIFALILQISISQSTLEAYKMFAYEDSQNAYGSKVGSVELQAVHYSQNVFRKLALIHFDEVNLDSLIKLVLQRPFGLVVILPENGSQYEIETWNLMQSVFKGKFTKLAVYYVKETASILETYNKKTESEIKFSIKSVDTQPIINLQLEDFYGYFQEVKTQNQLPTILLVASYDSFLPSAEFNMGFKNYKSGAFLLLSAMKYMKDTIQFQQNLEQCILSRYNVMFYLTSSKHNNLSQMFNWMNKPENYKFTNAIQQIIYLDSIQDGKQIYLQEVKGQEMQPELLKKIENIAQLYKIGIQRKDMEPMSGNKQAVSVLSNIAEPLFTPFKPILGEKEDSKKNYVKMSQFLSELLMSICFDYDYLLNDEKFVKENEEFQTNLFNFFNDLSFYPTNLSKGSYINKQLFQQYSMSYNKITYQSNYQFFTSGPAELSILQNQSAFIDVYIFGGIVLYLYILKKAFQYLLK